MITNQLLKDNGQGFAYYRMLEMQAMQHNRTIAAEITWIIHYSQDHELFKLIIEMHPELQEQQKNKRYNNMLKAIIEMHPELEIGL